MATLGVITGIIQSTRDKTRGLNYSGSNHATRRLKNHSATTYVVVIRSRLSFIGWTSPQIINGIIDHP
jgi:hypothetical protein